MYPEEGGHMERKIVFIVIFSILIISNVFCIATIIKINSGLTQLEKGKEKIGGKIDSLIKYDEEITREIHKQRERAPMFAQEIKKRLSNLEQRMGMGREKGAEHMREIERRFDALEQHDRAWGDVRNMGRKIEERFSELERRMDFRTKDWAKQIERRLNGLERHGGDQARRWIEDLREMEKKFERFEERVHKEFRKLQ